MQRHKKREAPTLHQSGQSFALLESYHGQHSTDHSAVPNRRVTGRQLAFLAKLISEAKTALGLVGVPTVDLDKASASRLIAELRRVRRERRR